MDEWKKDPRDPDPAMIRAARGKAELTQTQAAEMVGASLRAWQEWEGGRRRMDYATWYLFKAKLERHEPEHFVKAVDGSWKGVDPDRELRPGGREAILREDYVCLQTTGGFEVRVRVRFDRADGLVAGVYQGVINGFPNEPSDVAVKGRFAIGDPVVFLEEQVAHVHLRNEAHFAS